MENCYYLKILFQRKQEGNESLQSIVRFAKQKIPEEHLAHLDVVPNTLPRG